MNLYVKNLEDNTIHEVRKYIKSDDGVQSIWCNTWYGRHVIGVDCKFTKDHDGDDVFDPEGLSNLNPC